jgi:hypothetical protein
MQGEQLSAGITIRVSTKQTIAPITAFFFSIFHLQFDFGTAYKCPVCARFVQNENIRFLEK